MSIFLEAAAGRTLEQQEKREKQKQSSSWEITGSKKEKRNKEQKGNEITERKATTRKEQKIKEKKKFTTSETERPDCHEILRFLELDNGQFFFGWILKKGFDWVPMAPMCLFAYLCASP